MSIVKENQVSWRDDENDMPHRREVVRQITKLLEARKANPNPKWKKELPFKAKKLEEYLYRTASSLEEYADEKTLKQRLKKAALSIARQFRIRTAYKAGLYSKPSPRNSLIRGSSVFSVRSRQSTGSLADVWKVPETITTPSPRNSVSFWDVSGTSHGATTSSSLWDVPGTANVVPTTHVVVPNKSLAELQELQAANRKLQDEILENIRQQKEALRAMTDESSGIDRQSSSSGPDIVPV